MQRREGHSFDSQFDSHGDEKWRTVTDNTAVQMSNLWASSAMADAREHRFLGLLISGFSLYGLVTLALGQAVCLAAVPNVARTL